MSPFLLSRGRALQQKTRYEAMAGRRTALALSDEAVALLRRAVRGAPGDPAPLVELARAPAGSTRNMCRSLYFRLSTRRSTRPERSRRKTIRFFSSPPSVNTGEGVALLEFLLD